MKKTYDELELELLQTQFQLAQSNAAVSQLMMNKLGPEIEAKMRGLKAIAPGGVVPKEMPDA